MEISLLVPFEMERNLGREKYSMLMEPFSLASFLKINLTDMESSHTSGRMETELSMKEISEMGRSLGKVWIFII